MPLYLIIAAGLALLALLSKSGSSGPPKAASIVGLINPFGKACDLDKPYKVSVARGSADHEHVGWRGTGKLWSTPRDLQARYDDDDSSWPLDMRTESAFWDGLPAQPKCGTSAWHWHYASISKTQAKKLLDTGELAFETEGGLIQWHTSGGGESGGAPTHQHPVVIECQE